MNKKGLSYFIALVMAIIITIALGSILFASSTGLFGSWYANKQVQVTGVYKLSNGTVVVSIKNAGNVPVRTDVSLQTSTGVSQSLGTGIPLRPGESVSVKRSITGVEVGDFVEIILTLDDGSVRVFRTPVQ